MTNHSKVVLVNEVAEKIFAGGDRISDISYIKNDEYKYPIFSNGEKNDGLLCYSKVYTIDKSAITISARGTVGYVAYREGKFTPAIRLITVIPNEKIVPLYLKHALNELEYEKKGSGAGQLTVPEFKKMKIRVVNKSKQQEFADFISKYDKLKFREISLVKICIKSKFDEMFGNHEFENICISDLFDLQLGKTPERNNVSFWNNNQNKWISVADMSRYDRFTTTTLENISDFAVQETNMKVVPKNTVIMSFKLTIGRTAITSEDIYTNEAIVAFIDKKLRYIDNDYLRISLNAHDWSFGMMNAVKGYTLNKKSIGKTKIKVPPKTLQMEFSEFISKYDKLKFIFINLSKKKK